MLITPNFKGWAFNFLDSSWTWNSKRLQVVNMREVRGYGGAVVCRLSDRVARASWKSPWNRFTALHGKTDHISLLCLHCNDIECYNTNAQQSDMRADEKKAEQPRLAHMLSLAHSCHFLWFYRKTVWLISAVTLFKSEHSLLSLQRCGLCLTHSTDLKTCIPFSDSHFQCVKINFSTASYQQLPL